MSAPVVHVRTFCHIGGRWTNCIRSYEPPPTFTFELASVAAFREAMGTWWSFILRPWMSSQARYVGFEWDYIDEEGALLVRERDTTGAGDAFGPAHVLPTQVCGLCVLHTVEGSPARTRALQYLPFVPAARSGAEGKLTAAGLNLLNNVASDIAAPVQDGLGRLWRPVSYRRATRELFRIASGVGRVGLAQQRRRGSSWPSDAAPGWI